MKLYMYWCIKGTWDLPWSSWGPCSKGIRLCFRKSQMERSGISRNRFHSTLSTAPCIQLSNISPRTLSRTKLYVKPDQTKPQLTT